MGAVVRGLFLLVLAGCGEREIPLFDAQVARAGPVRSGPPTLYALLVANVLHDFPSAADQAWSKVEVFFEGERAVAPSDVERIYVEGPSGFRLDVANVPFGGASLNGYVQSVELGGLWYQALLPGSLARGMYTVFVHWRDGRIESHARPLEARSALLEAYRTHRARMQYMPTGAADADDLTLRWSTLAELGGPDAYYNAWISPGTGEAVDPNRARGDTIFADAIDEPSAGRNHDQTRMASPERPLPRGAYTWQVEILDSNLLDEINEIVFAPGQWLELQ